MQYNKLPTIVDFKKFWITALQNMIAIMILICYQMLEGSAMYLCEDWFDGNVAKHLFPKAKTNSQAISRLIKSLGNEINQRQFSRNYVKTFFPGQHGMGH